MDNFAGEQLTHKNIYYGEMVDLKDDGGIHCSCSVHFFNRKGVLVGRVYRFVKYEEIRRHPKGLCWPLKWSTCKNQFNKNNQCVGVKYTKWPKQYLYETLCRIITRLLKVAESMTYYD